MRPNKYCYLKKNNTNNNIHHVKVVISSPTNHNLNDNQPTKTPRAPPINRAFGRDHPLELFHSVFNEDTITPVHAQHLLDLHRNHSYTASNTIVMKYELGISLSHENLVTLLQGSWISSDVINLHCRIHSFNTGFCVMDTYNTSGGSFTEEMKKKANILPFFMAISTSTHFSSVLIVPGCKNQPKGRLVNFDPLYFGQKLREYHLEEILKIQWKLDLHIVTFHNKVITPQYEELEIHNEEHSYPTQKDK